MGATVMVRAIAACRTGGAAVGSGVGVDLSLYGTWVGDGVGVAGVPVGVAPGPCGVDAGVGASFVGVDAGVAGACGRDRSGCRNGRRRL